MSGQNHHQFITLLMSLTFLALALELILWVGPITESKRLLDERQEVVDRSVQLLGSRSHYDALLEKVLERKTKLKETEKIWSTRVDTLGAKPSRFSGNTAEELRIDYKVALFNVRARLYREAAKAGVQLPPRLGLPETLGADEEALVRLWELETVENLIMLLIKNDIPMVDSVRNLPVELKRPALNGGPPMYEFPVAIEFRCNYEKLGSLQRVMQEQGSYFTVRNVWVERVLPESVEDDLLKMSLVVSVPFFQELVGVELLEPEEVDSAYERMLYEEGGP